MALAETTVVETVSGGWPQVLSEPEMLLEADQLAARTRVERLRRREATCHGVRMARVSSNTRSLPRDRWLVPFGTSLTVRARGRMNETGKLGGERASVSEPVPAAE